MNFTEKRISIQTLLSLKEALVAIFWAKKDLRSFIDLTIDNNTIVSTIDWEQNTKFVSVSELIDRMAKRPDIFQNDLLKLIREASNFTDFSHLNKWEDSAIKIQRAKEATQKLRNQTSDFFDTLIEKEKSEKLRAVNQAKIKDNINYRDKLEEFKNEFIQLSMNNNHQARGIALEKFLNKLFVFFDLDPKSSFKIVGEQIDGAFTFDNTDYLLEAKWQNTPINAQELYGFGGKINGKFKNTCGLYVSLGGYSSESTQTSNSSVNSIILMDGLCLIQVLEGRIKLDEMLYRKRRHASQTGEIFYKITGV